MATECVRRCKPVSVYVVIGTSTRHGHSKKERRSLPELLHRDVLLGVLLHDLGDGHFEVLLRDVDAPLPQRKHARLCTYCFALRTRRSLHGVGDLLQVDASHEIHLARMNLENVQTSLYVINPHTG